MTTIFDNILEATPDMTPEERTAAREKFKKHQHAPVEQRAARRQKWEEYKALPESEKRKFRENAAKQGHTKTVGGKNVPQPLSHRPSTAPQPNPLIPSLSGTAAAR